MKIRGHDVEIGWYWKWDFAKVEILGVLFIDIGPLMITVWP